MIFLKLSLNNVEVIAKKWLNGSTEVFGDVKVIAQSKISVCVFSGGFCIRHPFLSKCLLQMRKTQKIEPNPIFL